MPSLPRFTLLMFALVLSAPLVGCGGFRAPVIRVVDARVVEQTEQGVAVDFVLEGTNTNDEELPLQVVKYTLSIDGERVFRGERMAEATLRRMGTQTFVLPVAAEWDDLPGDRPEGDFSPRTRKYRLAGTLQYIAPGALAEVFFDTGVRRPSVHFATEGELTLTPAPPGDPEAGPDLTVTD